MNHRAPAAPASDDAAIREAAARWIVRLDRHLSPAEEAEMQTWLGADPRHAAALEQAMASWRKLRAIGVAARRLPRATAPSPAPGNWLGAGSLAAAAALVLAWGVWHREPGGARPAATATVPAAPATPEVTTRLLADGSEARLKQGAELDVTFSPAERHVRLLRGEAFFTVAPDAARPFLVAAGGVTVCAVGTAFAVRCASHAVDVLVREGTVRVTPPTPAVPDAGAPPDASALVGAGQRAVVAHAPAPQAASVVVTAVSREEMARVLAWSEPMLELGGATLGELVAAFAQRAGRRIEIADPALAAVRIGGRFPTDDVDGFVQALAEVYDVKAETRPDGSLVLRPAR